MENQSRIPNGHTLLDLVFVAATSRRWRDNFAENYKILRVTLEYTPRVVPLGIIGQDLLGKKLAFRFEVLEYQKLVRCAQRKSVVTVFPESNRDNCLICAGCHLAEILCYLTLSHIRRSHS